MTGGRIIYARGFPYGAPLAIIRGGATRRPEVKAFIKAQGFRWDGSSHAWTHYLDRSDFAPVLATLRDVFGCEVRPKDGMSESYLIDLDSPTGARPVTTEERA